MNGVDPYSELIYKEEEFLEERRQLTLYQREHGKSYDKILNSQFDDKKVIFFENSLQWAKKNIIQSYWKLRNNQINEIDKKFKRQIRNHSHEDIKSLIDFYLKNNKNHLVEREFSDLKKEITAHLKSNFYPVENPKKCFVSISEIGSIDYKETEEKDYKDFVENLQKIFDVSTSKNQGLTFESNNNINLEIKNLAEQSLKEGLSLNKKIALVTGAGESSIAIEVVKNLLSSGMKVVVTTSSYSVKKLNFYKKTFQENSTLGSSLVVVPFSQGSTEDIKNLVSYLTKQDLLPDLLLPFGAVGEENTLSTLSDDSLASLKVMLFGVEKLIGELAKQFQINQVLYKKFSIILPLSPNHGIFGRDGMYAETKIGLETLFKKWYSENKDWGHFCKIIGARIGWVRGTGLMEMNNIVAPDLESNLKIKTFSQSEMAFLLTLLYTYQSQRNSEAVLLADLTGGLGNSGELNQELSNIRSKLLKEAAAIRNKNSLHSKLEALIYTKKMEEKKVHLLSKSLYSYPDIPTDKQLESFGNLQELDLSKIICVVGYGEIGPCGNSFSRWEIEKDGLLSIEGSIELAWMTGLIEYQKTDSGYSWVDKETGELVLDWEVKSKYEERLLSSVGIRLLENSDIGFRFE